MTFVGRCCGLFILLSMLGACASAPRIREELNLKDDRTSRVIHHEFIILPKYDDKKFEIFWMRPETEGKFPLIIALHGNQDPERPGAAVWTHGFLQRMVDDRFVAVSVSQPGFGNSDGPSDYCGELSQGVLRAVIKYFKNQPFVDGSLTALYGVGRGATLAGLVAAKEPSLKALVLQAGIYDLPNEFPGLKKSADPEDREIAESIEKEIGHDPVSFLDRSVVMTAGQIRANTLILVGGKDYPESIVAAKELETALKDHDTPVHLVEFHHSGHVIPVDKRIDQVDPFLEQNLIPK